MSNGKSYKQYTIKNGDTLSKIARVHGTDYRSLYNLVGPDKLRNSERLRSGSPHRIYPGEVIYVLEKVDDSADDETGNGESSATGSSTGKASGKYHGVRQGECLDSIAAKYGFSWEFLWNHLENRKLKEKRKNPNALMPGDRIFIPDLRERKEPEPDKQKHTFTKKGSCYLHLVLLDEDNEPRSDVQYELEVDGKSYFERTDDLGAFKKPVPPDAKSCKLYVNYREDAYILDLRHLDPDHEVSGLQARLNNLGYAAGDLTGKLNDTTRAALIAFQVDYDLDSKGELNKETLEKLKEVYGN